VLGNVVRVYLETLFVSSLVRFLKKYVGLVVSGVVGDEFIANDIVGVGVGVLVVVEVRNWVGGIVGLLEGEVVGF
jgi:hypothetical protein